MNTSIKKVPGAMRRMASQVKRLIHVKYLILFYFYHKCVFRITNTKFDISYCVFRESFLDDQYGIRKFLDRLNSPKKMLFLDIGRNHGLVFYYTMFYMIQHNSSVRVINYYGIEPAPLKFVYFNFQKKLAERGIQINYHLIDRAVVFNDQSTVKLKYGEHNFGNFNVAGSNYEEKNAAVQSRFEYVEIIVETMKFSEVLSILEASRDDDAVIIKIDCKNRTDYMFVRFLEVLPKYDIDYLLSCESDGSSSADLSCYRKRGGRVLTAGRVNHLSQLVALGEGTLQ